MNIQLSEKVIRVLAQQGVEDILLCAGARNSPLVVCLEKAKNVNIHNFFEERSAGFFALSLAQRKNKPVAIVTTSGTAVAELIPAAVEATYSGTPLIFVTADRPRDYRGTGAPQAIDQVGIFFKYVETCKDIEFLDEDLDLSMWTRTAPIQINVCFNEPLIDGEIPVLDFALETKIQLTFASFESKQSIILEQPVVIVSGLTVDQAALVAPQLARLGAPIYAEATSNLRNDPSLQKLFLKSGDSVVRKIFEKGFCKSVLRIGGVPTLRFWRDLEEIFREVPVTSVSELEWTGLARPSRQLVGLKNISKVKSNWTEDLRKNAFQLDQNRSKELCELLNKYPKSEASLISKLSGFVEDKSFYIGNSLPIREWDLVCPFEKGPSLNMANRGANGIDGQVSSFLGMAMGEVAKGETSKSECWAMLGDLTTMYDLSGLWASKFLSDTQLRLVIINNCGGMIFKNMFGKEIFLNQHELEFSKWAAMWNWGYFKCTEIPAAMSWGPHSIIEIVPDRSQTEAFNLELKKI